MMTTDEKREFVNGLIDDVHSEILRNIPKMPESWDGIELRRYIAAKFDQSWKMHSVRLRNYENDVLVLNL